MPLVSGGFPGNRTLSSTASLSRGYHSTPKTLESLDGRIRTCVNYLPPGPKPGALTKLSYVQQHPAEPEVPGYYPNASGANGRRFPHSVPLVTGLEKRFPLQRDRIRTGALAPLRKCLGHTLPLCYTSQLPPPIHACTHKVSFALGNSTHNKALSGI